MYDLLAVAIAAAFFALTWWLVRFSDHLDRSGS